MELLRILARHLHPDALGYEVLKLPASRFADELWHQHLSSERVPELGLLLHAVELHVLVLFDDRHTGYGRLKLLVRHGLLEPLDPCDAQDQPPVFHQLPPAAQEDRLAELERVRLRPLRFNSADHHMPSTFASRASSPLTCASLAQCSQDARRVGHPPGALPHGFPVPRFLVVLASVTQHRVYLRQTQDALHAGLRPRARRGRVLMQEVPALVVLLLVDLAHEPQVDHGSHLFSVHLSWIPSCIVQRLPAAEPGAHRAADDKHRLLYAELLARCLAPFQAVKVPRHSVLVRGRQVQREPRRYAQALQPPSCCRDSRRTVELTHDLRAIRS